MEQQNNEQNLKNNPWTETKSIDTADAHIKQDTKQCIKGLPAVIADDIILQNLLKPTNDDGVKKPSDDLGDNVIPLQVNFGGQETKEIDGKKLAIRQAPDGRAIKYDPDKGFVMSSWSNFELDPQSTYKLVTDEKGIFIKHITSTIINPNDLGIGKGSVGAEIDIKSISSTSNSLASNAWSNVLLYKPKEKIFKYDMENKRLVMENSDDKNSASTSQQQQQQQ